jgi:hypothetical protein
MNPNGRGLGSGLAQSSIARPGLCLWDIYALNSQKYADALQDDGLFICRKDFRPAIE